MTTVLLIRHARSTANARGILAGRTPGVELSPEGVAQLPETAARLADLPLACVVSSPMERCVQTAQALLTGPNADLELVLDDGLIECDYGDWSGRPLAELRQEPLWKDIDRRPSTVTFPGGESMRAMSDRVVAAVHERDRLVRERHGKKAVWAAVTHADLVKAVVAHSLGTPLDQFQRIHVSPASITVLRLTGHGAEVLAVNTGAGGLAHLAAAPEPVPGGGDV